MISDQVFVALGKNFVLFSGGSHSYARVDADQDEDEVQVADLVKNIIRETKTLINLDLAHYSLIWRINYSLFGRIFIDAY